MTFACGPLNPLNIGRFLLLPGRKVYGLAIDVSITVDVARRMAEIAAKAAATLWFVQYSMPKNRDESAKILAFLDFTESKVQPKELIEQLKKLDAVRSVEIIKPKKSGLIADTHFFPLVIENERVVIFRRTVYEGLMAGIRKQFGSAGEAFLFYAGFNIGIQVYDNYVKLAGTENVEALAETIATITKTMGWCIVEKYEIEVKRKTARISVYHSFECEQGKKSGKSYSQFIRGILAGLFTRLFKQEVSVEETMCIAKGDPYCEFKIQPK